MYPGSRDPRRRHRRGAQRGEPRHRVARPARAVPAAEGGDRADPPAVVGGAGHLRRHLLHGAQHHDLRQARRPPVPIYIGAAGPAATRLAGRIADGFITTSAARSAELYTETLLPGAARGPREGRPLAGRDRHAHRGQGLARPRPAIAAREKTRFWAPLALSPEEKMGVDDPIEMQRLGEQLPIERAASRFIVSDDPDEHVERIALVHRSRVPPPRLPRPRPRPGGVPAPYGEEILPRLRARFGA